MQKLFVSIMVRKINKVWCSIGETYCVQLQPNLLVEKSNFGVDPTLHWEVPRVDRCAMASACGNQMNAKINDIFPVLLAILGVDRPSLVSLSFRH